MPTRQQEYAKRAYDLVRAKQDKKSEADYARICKTFPALIHNSGLCQAIAFAEAKGRSESGDGKHVFALYLNDLAAVLGADGATLAKNAREYEVLRYQRLTRDASEAASWLKRYAEALLKDAVSADQKTGVGPGSDGTPEGSV